MEYLISLDDAEMNQNIKTVLMVYKGSFECKLTSQLKTSIGNMIASWKKIDCGIKDDHWDWDLHWFELNAGINSAKADHEITSKQEWHLRKIYLKMNSEESR